MPWRGEQFGSQMENTRLRHDDSEAVGKINIIGFGRLDDDLTSSFSEAVKHKLQRLDRTADALPRPPSSKRGC
jgi:hypothetical protein